MSEKGLPGRKPKDNPLKVTNFRLSNRDLKLIDKKGIGKNSSERLRFIIEEYKTPKLNRSKRHKSYKSRKFLLESEAITFFEKINQTWSSTNKLEFLSTTSLRNDIQGELEELYRWKFRAMPQLVKLEQYGWQLGTNIFRWEKNRTLTLDLKLKKGEQVVSLFVAEESDEYNTDSSGETVEYECSAKEEDLISLFYEEIQDLLFNSDYIQEERMSDYKKVYPGGDYYRSIEYNHVVIIEMEHAADKGITVISYLKELEEATSAQ